MQELPSPTIIHFLLGDHRETVILIGHFEKAYQAGDKLMMEKLADSIAMSIRLHSQGEMDSLYPFMEKTLGKKASHVDQCLEEHRTVESEVMKALEMRKQGGDELENTVQDILRDFKAHLLHEEEECVVNLLDSENCKESDLKEVCNDFVKAKMAAPLDPQKKEA